MEPLATDVLLVDHNFKAVACRFAVKTTANADIMDLKEKAQEMRPDELSSSDLPVLHVWKMKGDMIVKYLTPQELSEILGKIDVNDKNTIRSLDDEEKVADIGLSFGETLLLQVPAVVTHVSPVRNPITMDVDPEYEHCYLEASTQGDFRESDIELNDIYDASSDGAPTFVTDYEGILSQKRKLAPHMRTLAEALINKRIFAEYFCSMEESSESSLIVYRPELDHLNHILSVDAQCWRTLDPENARFNEADAYWLPFSAVTKYYEKITSTDDDEVAIIRVKQSLDPWPYELLIKVDGNYHTYRPKSDFLLQNYTLPQLAVEVNSQPQNRSPVDLFRLMLQGASVVRFANTKLGAYQKEKNFVFVAIYINSSGFVDRYLLYQDAKKDPHKVYRKVRRFKLARAMERIRFALELYNLSSTWHDDEDIKNEIDKLQLAVDKDSPKFTAFGSKRPATDRGDGRRTKRKTGNAGDAAGGTTGGAAERLDDSGYEVVPDVLETDGGTWELIDKPPPHVRIVYRRRDPNKTRYIAKHLCEGSNELAIHEYLQSRPSRSPYIILFIEAVPSTTREWLILPKLYSIRNQWSLGKGGVAGRVRLSWGLIKGLAYLHELKIAHRDIKPGNLVRDYCFDLKIIDFDIAIKVQDENTEIDGYWGTESWTAPEIGNQDGPTQRYSPIKADRWSCGRVILHHIMAGVIVKNADRRLLKFANQLMAKDPQQRPSQLAWQALLAPPLTVSHDRCRQDVGEHMKPPDAKKRRLESELVQS